MAGDDDDDDDIETIATGGALGGGNGNVTRRSPPGARAQQPQRWSRPMDDDIAAYSQVQDDLVEESF